MKKKNTISTSSLNKLYDEWIDNIVRDCSDSKVLIEHVMHHAEEGLQEGITATWFASIENLIEIIKRKYKQGPIAIDTKLERLYQHWVNDPANMTPPPQLASFSKMIEIEVEKQKKERDTFSSNGGS